MRSKTQKNEILQILIFIVKTIMIKIYQPSSKEKQRLFSLFKITFSLLIEFFKFYYGDYILPEGFILIDIIKETIIEKFKNKKSR